MAQPPHTIDVYLTFLLAWISSSNSTAFVTSGGHLVVVKVSGKGQWVPRRLLLLLLAERP